MDEKDLKKEIGERMVHYQMNLIASVIIFSILLVGVFFLGVFEYNFEDNYYNCSERVMEKEIVWENGLISNKFHYYIFTNTYCFDVDLNDYNQLDVNDTVVLEVNGNDAFARLHMGDKCYVSR